MNKRNAIILLVLLLAIGFAAVSTTLFINGTIMFGTNEEEFTVIFTKAIVDDVDLSNTVISKDGKTITYETKELAFIDEESILDFTVKNNSTQYDAEININCIGGANEGTYYELEYDLPTFVAAQSEIDGYVTARMIRSSVNEIIEELTCTLNVTAMERTDAAEVIVNSPLISYSDEDGDGKLSLGDIVTLGNETTASKEQFYVLSSDETNTRMMSMYNLYVGNECTSNNTSSCITYTNPTGIQDSTMLGVISGETIRRGTTVFSNTSTEYSGSVIEGYVSSYSTYLANTLGITNTATIISKEELEEVIGSTLEQSSDLKTLGAPEWIFSTSYWTRSDNSDTKKWLVSAENGVFGSNSATVCSYAFGVRPVVTIDTNLFETDEDEPLTSLNVDENGNGIADLGDMISLGNESTASIERFYVISNDGTNIKMLSEYNLYVGGEYNPDTSTYTTYENPTGIQDSTMIGFIDNFSISRGVTAFSSYTISPSYSGSIVEGYVNNYSDYLSDTLGVENTATLLSRDDLKKLNNGYYLSDHISIKYKYPSLPEFLYSTSYWNLDRSGANGVYTVWYDSTYIVENYSIYRSYGVRPLVTISADLLN